MPSKTIEQRMLSPNSYFFEEIHFPAERQVGFWNSETMRDQKVGMSQTLGSQSILPSSLEKFATVGGGGQSTECVELTQPCPIRDQSAKLNLEQLVGGGEKMNNLAVTSWRSISQSLGSRSNVFVQPAPCSVESNEGYMGIQYGNGLFSSSLSEILTRKLRLPSNDVLLGQSVDDVTSQLEEEEPFESLKDIEAHTIGNLLPDDDELISTAFNDLEFTAQPASGDGMEDLDLFSSGGGLELEGDDGLSSSKDQEISDFSRATSNGELQGLHSSSAGKHPYGEQPSRTLFVRNINSNIEDSELRVLFEQYGDVRALYTACKHRGFVMISYYDIRAACNAMKALQNKLLRRRKLDIHFSIPKDNPSDKDINQGILVVFNLDFSISNNELCQIFGVYGEIKQISENCQKHQHKFIEFYDVRAAEAALHAVNRSEIAGKRIKVELSHPGSTRCLMQQASANHDESLESIVISSCMENEASPGLNSAIKVPVSPLVENEFHGGFSPSVPKCVSSGRVAKISDQCGLAEPSQGLGQLEFSLQQMPIFHPHSLPDHYHSDRHVNRLDSSRCSIELDENDFGSRNGSYPRSGHYYMWHDSNSYQSHPPNTMIWPNSPTFISGIHGHHPPQLHAHPRAPSHMVNTVSPLQHHHVGSAPVNSSPWDRQHAYAREFHDSSCFLPVPLGSTGFSRNLTAHPMELTSHNIFPHVNASCIDPSLASTYVGFQSPQQRYHMFPDRNSASLSNSYDGTHERYRSRRNEASSNQADNKKQYELDINRIVSGEDTRTTLMIKNIPNKYTSKMLLAAIDEHHHGTYDFIYLPIDFKNKCNVGYAFINIINPLHIIPFYETFNGKKWEKFNSEKVASLAFARIQGKVALIAHFQNSSLMNEDKRCRPILFHSDGPNAGDQEPFPMGGNVRSRPGRARSNGSEENSQGSPSTLNEGESSNGLESSSASS